MIKAYIFWMQAEDVFPEDDADHVRKLTLSHYWKHAVILYFSLGLSIASLLTDEEKVQELRNQYRNASRDEIEYSKKYERELIRFKETMRQRSIYVDVIDGAILSPNDVEKENVERLKEGIVSRRNALQQIFELPHDQKRKVIETMKKAVRKVEDENAEGLF